MKVLLVRHAKAKDRSTWLEDDSSRPLSKAGLLQAQALGDRLSPYRPVLVASSPALRCVQTVTPLAEALGASIEQIDQLGEMDWEGPGAALRVLRDFAGRAASVVICSHGDVIPALLGELQAADGLVLPEVLRCAKGSTWVVEGDGSQFEKALYLEAP